MTERFVTIIKKLCDEKLLKQERLEEVKAQIHKAAPLEDEKEKVDRENAVNQLFNGFTNLDEKITQQAINTFKTFVEDMKSHSMNKEGYLTDNRYCLGLIHLMCECLDILAKRGGELSDGWFGKEAKRFCYGIMGAFLQLEQWVPERVRQIFRINYGVSALFWGNLKPDRSIFDESGDLYQGVGTEYVLGVNSYFNDLSRAPRVISRCHYHTPESRGAEKLQDLLRALTSASRLYAPSAMNPSHTEPMCHQATHLGNR